MAARRLVSRLRTHPAPGGDDGGKLDAGEVVGGGPTVARSDASAILQAAEHGLDAPWPGRCDTDAPGRSANSRASELAAVVAQIRATQGSFIHGCVGPGTPQHPAGEMFRQAVGFTAPHVPYSGSAPAATALLAGEIPFMSDNLALWMIRGWRHDHVP